MKKTLSILLFAILFPIAMMAQLKIELSDLVFHSTYEKQCFTAINLQQSANIKNTLALLMAGNPQNGEKELLAAQQKLDLIIADLEKEKIGEKKLKKSAKIIFDRVHSYLRLYKETAHFDQIFNDGTYNCLTASALYAFILEHFDIPYALIEMPTHVFVLLDPGGENIGLETTDPKEGVFRLDKSKIVAELRQKKMISDEESRGKTDEEVYDTYFKEAQIKINLNQLIGLAYHNFAIEKLNEKAFKASIEYSEKSLFLYPNEDRQIIRMTGLSALTETMTIEKPENFAPFFALYDYPIMHKTLNEKLPNIFEDISKKYLINDYDQQKYNQFYQYFIQQLNEKQQPTLDFVYINYLYIGVNAGIKRNYTKSMVALDSAYSIKSGNLRLQELIATSLTTIITKDNYTFHPTNTDSLLTKYTFLKEHEGFMSLHCYQKLKPIVDLFDEGKDEEGFAAVTAYQPKLDAIKSTIEHQLSIEIIYDAIFRLFVRKDDYKQCRHWLEKGLALEPGNDYLLHQMEMVKEHISIYGEDPYPNKLKPRPDKPKKGKN
jgi:hypothetical protein